MGDGVLHGEGPDRPDRSRVWLSYAFAYAFGLCPQSHESRSSHTAWRLGRSVWLALLWDACDRADHHRQKERTVAPNYAYLALAGGFGHRGRGLPRR